MRLILFFIFFLNITHASENFPTHEPLRTRINFWKRIYTEVNSNEGLIHDADDLSFYYTKISLPNGRRARISKIKTEKRKIISHLKSILKKKFKNLNDEEMRIVSLVEDKTETKLKSMIRNIRLQAGLKDRYYKGLVRSYKYMDFIKATFKKYGLPNELVYLPHVESSFNYEAYSKVGAAGIWQFMRATAKRFGLKVSYIIDERRDPLKATDAAARLLQANYRKLQSWPLALTAYNHGARSMERAVAKLGTKDIAKIIEGYEGRRFGFASKNFYATFMATVEISESPEKYFPSFHMPEKFEYSTIKLPKSFQIKHLTKTLEMPQSLLRQYNPAIRHIAYRSPLFLPKGLELQIPKTTPNQLRDFSQKLAQLEIPKSEMELDKVHIVSRGDSLYTISRLYKMDIGKIIQFNQMTDPRRIYPGMKIKIPGEETQVVIAVPEIKKKVLEKPLNNLDKVSKIDDAPVETIVAPVEIKEVPRVDLPSKSITQRFRDFANSIFSEENEAPKVDPVEVAKENNLLNLSSYKLDLTFISQDIYEITVETEETLGHYAEWAKVPTQVIRDLNQMGRNSSIRLGQKVKVKIFTEQVSDFKSQRNEFHLSIQEDFYEQFLVQNEEKYLVKRGDNLSAILERFNLPFWLLRRTQANGDIQPNLRVGDILLIPKVTARGEEVPTETLEEPTTLK
ncbi:MAG: transglycosylase SLT domain-containing protein [Bdellovibrionota bacterium]|nr:transglycosylase SLT domain-containing protein [Bdellovibrionota bacterium]